MKKILLIIGLIFSFSAGSQTLPKAISSKLVHYFADIQTTDYVSSIADVTIRFSIINKLSFVTFINNRVPDSVAYFLTEKKETAQLYAAFVVTSYYCKSPKEPERTFFLTFVFHKDTQNLHSLSVCDGISLLIYDIDYTPKKNTL